MPFWGWLIIIGVSVIATLIVSAVLFRRKQGQGTGIPQTAHEERERYLEQKVEALTGERERLVKESVALAKKLESIQAWYEKTKEILDNEKKKEFERLSSDDAALDSKLDDLLSQ